MEHGLQGYGCVLVTGPSGEPRISKPEEPLPSEQGRGAGDRQVALGATKKEQKKLEDRHFGTDCLLHKIYL